MGPDPGVFCVTFQCVFPACSSLLIPQTHSSSGQRHPASFTLAKDNSILILIRELWPCLYSILGWTILLIDGLVARSGPIASGRITTPLAAVLSGEASSVNETDRQGMMTIGDVDKSGVYHLY